MSVTKMLKATLALLFMFSLVGCGGDDGNSNSNGSLTLVATAPITGSGFAVLNATATLQPGAGISDLTPGLTGAEVTFKAIQSGYNSATGLFETLETYSYKAKTNDLGVAIMEAHNFAQSLVMATTIQVTASSQGLNTLTVSIPVPKFEPPI